MKIKRNLLTLGFICGLGLLLDGGQRWNPSVGDIVNYVVSMEILNQHGYQAPNMNVPHFANNTVLPDGRKAKKFKGLVVAMQGDVVEIAHDTVFINGKKIVIETKREKHDLGPVKVPFNHVFIISDSDDPEMRDSCDLGFLDMSQISPRPPQLDINRTRK